MSTDRCLLCSCKRHQAPRLQYVRGEHQDWDVISWFFLTHVEMTPTITVDWDKRAFLFQVDWSHLQTALDLPCDDDWSLQCSHLAGQKNIKVKYWLAICTEQPKGLKGWCRKKRLLLSGFVWSFLHFFAIMTRNLKKPIASRFSHSIQTAQCGDHTKHQALAWISDSLLLQRDILPMHSCAVVKNCKFSRLSLMKECDCEKKTDDTKKCNNLMTREKLIIKTSAVNSLTHYSQQSIYTYAHAPTRTKISTYNAQLLPHK